MNSKALYAVLLQEGMMPGEDFEAVFVDHGCDYPETYTDIQWMNEHGHPVTVIPGRRGSLDLYDYYWKYSLIPMRHLRICTEHFKVRPLLQYFSRPCADYLGIDAGEARRAVVRDREGITEVYPLVKRGIDRDGCREILRESGWPLPRKSGCFACPFQSLEEWQGLGKVAPQLARKAIALEDRANERLVGLGRPPIYLADPYPVRVALSGASARRMWRAEKRGQLNFLEKMGLEPCPYCRL